MTRLPFTEPTLKKLWTLSGNTCSFPKCSQKLIDNGDIIGEMCHIEAANATDPRYNSKQNDEERRHFENIILLCPTHHVITDNEEYTIKKLKEMKRHHEEKDVKKVFELSNEQFKKLQDKEINFIRQQNILTGSGQQIISQRGDVTVRMGLDGTEVMQLLKPFLNPNLLENAEQEVKDRSEKFDSLLINSISQKLTEEEKSKLIDPANLLSIKEARTINLKKNNEEFRNILSNLVIEHIKNNETEIERAVYSEVISTMGKLTSDGLKILALCFILYKTRYIEIIFDWEEVQKHVTHRFSALLPIKDTDAEITFLEAISCVTISTGNWNAIDYFRESYSYFFRKEMDEKYVKNLKLEDDIKKEIFSCTSEGKQKLLLLNNDMIEAYVKKKNLTSEQKKQLTIIYNQNFISHSEIESKISKIKPCKEILELCTSEKSISHLLPTAVGQIIAITYLQTLLKENFNISIWIK